MSKTYKQLSIEDELESYHYATCGKRCLESFERLSRPTLWAKTFAALLIGRSGWHSKRCVLTWRLKGTTYNRSYFLLHAKKIPTDGNGFGLLPTPTLKNATGGAVQVNENGKRQNSGGTEFSAQLHDLARSGMLPTPTAQQARGNASRNRNKGNLNYLSPVGSGSQLNPRFVAEMMGFPVNWTQLPFQAK